MAADETLSPLHHPISAFPLQQDAFVALLREHTESSIVVAVARIVLAGIGSMSIEDPLFLGAVSAFGKRLDDKKDEDWNIGYMATYLFYMQCSLGNLGVVMPSANFHDNGRQKIKDYLENPLRGAEAANALQTEDPMLFAAWNTIFAMHRASWERLIHNPRDVQEGAFQMAHILHTLTDENFPNGRRSRHQE